MRRFIALVYTLFYSVNAYAMHFWPQLDHTKCGVQTIPVVYNDTTYYETIQTTLPTSVGPLACCQHSSKVNISKELSLKSQFCILCDGSNQYLHIENKLTGIWQTILINDYPIAAEPHSEQGPQA